MTGTALFGTTNKSLDATYLYQFRAGKLNQNGKFLTADPRKGWAYLYVSPRSILHFCWFDQSTGLVEDNLVVNPENSSFKKVAQCKEGRVYRFKSADKRFFLWMQEPDKEDDNRIFENVKMHLLNNSKNSNDLLRGLNKLSQKDLFNILSMGVYDDLESISGTPVSKATGFSQKGSSSGKSKSKIQLDDLKNIMSSMGGSSRIEGALDLNNVINGENIKDILAQSEAKESLQQYLPTLPAADQEPLVDLVRSDFSDPISHIRSAQFRSALNAFNNALIKGGLGQLVSQFQMGNKVTEAANKGDIREFAKALEEQMKDQVKAPENEENDKRMDTS